MGDRLGTPGAVVLLLPTLYFEHFNLITQKKEKEKGKEKKKKNTLAGFQKSMLLILYLNQDRDFA